ncbi:MAG: metallophosphoesterase [Thermoguttaceae bacterium]|nr:metallophosphoesterase [Thermoguttaceae bacterium]
MQLSAGICLASSLPAVSCSAEAMNALDIRKLEINIGLEKPFRALHVSDSHFCFADERENERKRKLAASRARYFGNSEEKFDAHLAYAQKNDLLFLHTGDLIDFVSELNLEKVHEKFQGKAVFLSSGNHEFSQYVGEAKEDAAYKAQSYAWVQSAFPNDLTFCSRTINGVNFVAVDDVYYDFTPAQLKLFKKEVEKGLPIVMLCHCPLYTPELFESRMNQRGAHCAYLTGVPESLMEKYAPHRRDQQKPNAATLEFMAWLKEQPLVKAILCGHIHDFWSGPFSQYTMQYSVGAGYQGKAYEITFS